METKINIAEILKNVPIGTKLYSPLFGNVYLTYIGEMFITVRHHSTTANFYHNSRLYDYEGTEPMLFPSREMRDWSKFAWKKGDVLISMEGSKILFDKWVNEDYTKFFGKIKVLGDSHCYDTTYYNLVSEEEALEFIKSVEKINNSKLNRETLEVEKAQPEFKDGDIVCISGMGYLAYGIVKSIDYSSKKLEYYVLNDMSTLKFEDWLSFEDKQIQPITETQQIILFDTLTKKNKAWDTEKKEVVDLKPKVELKPFDKVLCRNSRDDTWEADFFARLTRKEIDYTQSGKYLCVGDLWMYCIPYNEETAHLLGTTDEWKGGEG